MNIISKKKYKTGNFSYNILAYKDKSILWHPFTQSDEWDNEEIIIIDKGKGNTLTDINGKKYIDGVASLWCNVHGHRVREIDDAIRKQIAKISHSSFLGLTHEQSIILSEMLINCTPNTLKRVFFSDNGSTAIEVAAKIAYQYWQQKSSKTRDKKKFIIIDNAYHGDTLGCVSLGGIQLFQTIFSGLVFKTCHISSPYVYRCSNNSKSHEECAKHCINELESILNNYADKTAGVLLEPMIQCAGGMITQPKGFITQVRKLCSKYNVLMIVDEVATGFGRTGKLFACDHENISPDIMCLGKGITGGYLPLAATICTEEIFEAFKGNYSKTFFHGHTYTANPLACSAAVANLKLFEKNQILKKLAPKILQMKNELNTLTNFEIVGDIRQSGIITGIEIVKNKRTKKPFPAESRVGRKIILEARKYGVLLRSLNDILVINPPLSITYDEISKIIYAVKQGIIKISEKNL